MQESKSQYTQNIGEGGVGYQECVIININGERYTATDDILIALSDILSLKLKVANERCSKLFVKQSVPEEDLIEEVNTLIFNIFQLSLDLSDPFHRLQLNRKIKIFHAITTQPTSTDNNKSQNDSETQDQNKQNSDNNSSIQQLVESLQKYNPKSTDTQKIKEDIKSFFNTSNLDELSFDFESMYRKIMQIALSNADKGYFAIIDELNKLIERLKRYKGESKIDFLEEDPLTPMDMEFKFAIYDDEGKNVAYKKDAQKDSGFEFFIERGSTQGYYDICCVIHDWNNALVDSMDIRDESDDAVRTTEQSIAVIKRSLRFPDKGSVTGEEFFKEYELAIYRKYQIVINNERGAQFGYRNYTDNGGKITIKKNVKNFSAKGEIILSGCRDRNSDEEKKFTFYIWLNERAEDSQNLDLNNEKKQKNVTATKVGNRKLRCPYCARELGINRRQKKNRYCDGKKAKDKAKEGVVCKNNHYLDTDFFDDQMNVSNTYDFENFDFESHEPDFPLKLPSNYTKNVSGVVSLIGKASSGKSAFISNFFGLTKNNDMNGNINWNSTIGPFISNSVFSFFMPNNQWELAQKRHILDDCTGTAYSDYVSVLYENGPKRSPNSKNSALVHLPFLLKMENSNNGVTSYMSFFDCPGEYIYDSNKKFMPIKHSEKNRSEHPVVNSDAYILFLDPTNMINDKIDNAEMIMQTLSDVVTVEKSKQRAVAVVFSKFDIWLDMLIKEHDTNADKFLEVVRRSAPDEGKNKVDYRGSKTERYIDACSDAIKDYFMKAYKDEFSSLEKLLNECFEQHKYFVVSAMGRGSSFRYPKEEEGEAPLILYRTKSNYNVDIVALWLAVQLGIIK